MAKDASAICERTERRRSNRWSILPLVVTMLLPGSVHAAKLWKLVQKGKLEAVQKELAKGASPRGEDGDPLLLYVNGRVDIAEVLIEAGADVNTPNRGGRTALIVAADGGYIDVVRLLLERGADVEVQQQASVFTEERTIEARPGIGWNALMAAVMNGHTDVVRVLLEAGADPEKKVIWKDAQVQGGIFASGAFSGYVIDSPVDQAEWATPLQIAQSGKRGETPIGNEEVVALLEKAAAGIHP